MQAAKLARRVSARERRPVRIFRGRHTRMSIGRLLRWAYVVVTVAGCSVAAASCGGGGSASTFGNPHPDGSFSDVDMGSDTGMGFGGDGGNGCVPKTCAAQGYSCGQNGDGCG